MKNKLLHNFTRIFTIFYKNYKYILNRIGSFSTLFFLKQYNLLESVQ